VTHVIFDLCIRDGACVEVCPVECIIPGQPESEWPWYYIDPDTCIDCGACVPECPVGAALPEEDLPEDQVYCTALNALFFTEGPGYAALELAPETTPVERIQFQHTFACDPTGTWLYLLDQDGGTIVQFAIDQTTGALSPTGRVGEMPIPTSLVFKI
jgi:ferredoxin